jgi:hypothetical protein
MSGLACTSELEHAGFDAAARRLADDLDALVVHLRYPLRHRNRWRSTDEGVKGRRVGIGCFRMMDGSSWVLSGSVIASCRVDLAVGMLGRRVLGVREPRRGATSFAAWC